MTTRREILQIGVASSVLPLNVGTVWASPSAASGRDQVVGLYKAIYDTRFAASRAFGQLMAAHGVAVAAMDGDITALWYENLYHEWQKGPAPIAGLTTRGALFCLERLAWDHRMKVVFRAQHSALRPGSVRHEMEGESALLSAVQGAAAEEDWIEVMSRVISHYPRTSTLVGKLELDTSSPAAHVPEGETLFSWVIAPRVRS